MEMHCRELALPPGARRSVELRDRRRALTLVPVNARAREHTLSAFAFDDLAPDYDASFTRTALGSTLRGLVWRRFDALFRPGQCVLELGCGTGEDAVRLARSGVLVVATDASERMLQVARTKAVAHGCLDRIEFHRLTMEAIPHSFSHQQFGGVVSNFGAINCAHDLAALARGVAQVCKPGARLLWVVMGRHVPWEWLWYTARGDCSKAFRRVRRAGVEWRGLHIRYPMPHVLSAMLRPSFHITRVAPLGCALPPSYASAWLERSPRIMRWLTHLEMLAQHRPALAWLADHYILEAQRTHR